jgi:hypothetical protein
MSGSGLNIFFDGTPYFLFLFCGGSDSYYFYGTPIFFVFCFDGILIFLQISSSWFKIRLHTKNQLPRLSGSGIKVCGGVVWVRHQ